MCSKGWHYKEKKAFSMRSAVNLKHSHHPVTCKHHMVSVEISCSRLLETSWKRFSVGYSSDCSEKSWKKYLGLEPFEKKSGSRWNLHSHNEYQSML